MPDLGRLDESGAAVADTLQWDEATRAVLEGTHAPAKGKSYDMLDPDTQESYQVPSSRVRELLKHGWTFEPEEKIAARNYVKEHGALTAFLTSAANSLSFGTLDIARENPALAKELGLSSKEARELLADRNPIASGLGFAAGIFGGPAKLMANIVGKATGATANLSFKAATKIVGEDAAQSLGKTGTVKAASWLAKQGIEGAVYSAPTAFAQAAVDAIGENPDLSAEIITANVLSDLGKGALANLAIGGTLLAASGARKGTLQWLGGNKNVSTLEEAAAMMALKGEGVGKAERRKLQASRGGDVDKSYEVALNAGRLVLNRLGKEGAEDMNRLGAALKNDLATVTKVVDGYGGLALYTKDDIAQARDKLLSQLEYYNPHADTGKIAQLQAEADAVLMIHGQSKSFDEFYKKVASRYKGLAKDNGTFSPALADARKAFVQDATELVMERVDTAIAKNATGATLDAAAISQGRQYERMGQKSLIDEWIQAKQNYASYKVLAKGAENKAAMAGNNYFGLGDHLIGNALVVALAGGTMPLEVALATFSLNKLRQVAGTTAAAKGLYNIARASTRLKEKAKPLDAFLQTGKTTKYATNALLREAFGVTSSDNDERAFEKYSDTIRELSARRTQLAEQIAEASEAGGHPAVKQAIATKLSTAFDYLDAELPRSPSAPDPLNPRKFTPAPGQRKAFERRAEVVLDPSIAMRAIASGTFNIDQLAALRAVYPEIAQQLSEHIIRIAGERAKPFDYRTRQQLRLLVMGGTGARAEKVQALQQNFATSKPEDRLGDNKISIADRSETELGKALR